jgi:hypothetical protein
LSQPLKYDTLWKRSCRGDAAREVAGEKWLEKSGCSPQVK